MAAARLTVAVTKGRILERALEALRGVGAAPDEPVIGARQLAFDSADGRFRLLVLRGADAVSCVRHGAADLGIVGRDVLLEHGTEGLTELLDLGICRCRLAVAAPLGAGMPEGQALTVATKFVNVTRRHFAARGRQARIVRMSGAMELFPALGLAELIVDLVDSGRTLAAHRLEVIETIASVSTRLVANRSALCLRHRDLRAFADALAAALA